MTRPRSYALAAGCVALAVPPLAYAATPTAATATAGEAAAASSYAYSVVADSVADGLDPFSFGCASINRSGDIAFRAGRLAPDGFNTVDGIYRANAGAPGLTTIVENGRRYDFIGRDPSMNDRGQVTFAAALDRGGEQVLRGSGGRLTVIAQTEPGRFNFFVFDTSVNNQGRVAFMAELDERFGFDEGLFSGTGAAVATHYLASNSRFSGSGNRPSINDRGDIAFDELVGDFDAGVFVTNGPGFKAIYGPEPDIDDFVSEPILNNFGRVAFERSFFDESAQQFRSEILSGRRGRLTTVADITGQFSSFGFRPASLNNAGQVAFFATLSDFTTSGVFVGSGPYDEVVRTGDTIDGDPVSNIVFCEEGLSDVGELAFVATLNDPQAPEGIREVVVRASPL